MTTDSDSLTLSLFDNTAAPDWNHHTPPISSDALEVEDTDDDIKEDGDAASLVVDPVVRDSNFHLEGDRNLARGWPARACDNIAAIRLSKALEQSGSAYSTDEQAQQLRVSGFGATGLARNCFRRPGEEDFRSEWREIGASLEGSVTPWEYAAPQRATQRTTRQRDDHPRSVAQRRTVGLYRGPRAGAWHGHRGRDRRAGPAAP